ncbi:MAG: hypothetical protein AAGM22_12255 [Acidobacteriota bacterium]
MKPLLLAQAASTLPLVGLIWTIQLVQYPLFARVGEAAFTGYHAGHSARITWVVLPLMLAELVSAGLLLTRIESPVTGATAWLGAALVGVIWLSTAFLQVPRHGELASGFDAASHQFLVASNWLRTVAWTARGGLVLWWLSRLDG